MQSWLGIVSGYYPWSVSCKTYTLWRHRSHDLQLCASCGSQPLGYSTTLSPSFVLLLASRTHGLCCKRGSALAAGKYDATPHPSLATKATLWTAGRCRPASLGWQEKVTQTSHTSNECSKLYTGPALSSGILKINFATFSKEDLQGTCHKRLGAGSGFWKGDFYAYSYSAPANAQTFASGLICLPGNPDFSCLI